ncbi:hypothetical protein [Butyrivibrio sp. YAB3001]|uniref:hypothetical protein n=1 Tax=Butyrivibrio sp. YAB3001 TaxID=1520812 RepID=UPI0008F63892|nr:hypothetical protein [Butyrivibrio sp. YAB3001]SFC31104.1 hypothetical protein SAMN02910398_01982 [Butyrivibrio sp. YAB3001]
MNNTAIDFLTYSYLGVTHDQCDWEMLLANSIDRACKDATNQGAYNTRVKEYMRKKSAEQKAESKNELQDIFRELFSDKKMVYDEWHKKACSRLLEGFKGLPFEYGNAQKWVNMTSKYLYIAYSLDLLKGHEKDVLEKYMRDFHVPIDSYILEGLKYTDIDCQIESSTWSRWKDSGKYYELQDVLRKRFTRNEGTVLVWENKLWTAVAQYRKTTDKASIKETIKDLVQSSESVEVI